MTSYAPDADDFNAEDFNADDPIDEPSYADDASELGEDALDDELAIAEETALAATAPDGLPSKGLLSFYDRLRVRVRRYVESHGGRLGQGAVEALLLVPDVFIFLVRISLDKDVPKKTRILVASALAYFVLPADFLPEILLGPTGYLDDLVLGLAVLAQAFGRDLEPLAAKHWSGSKSIRRVLRDVLESAHKLVGSNVYDRLKGFLRGQGIDLDAVAASGATSEAAANAR